MKKRIALAAALVLGLCLAAAAWAQDLTKQDLVREAKSKIAQVSPAQAIEMQGAGSVLLDCREPEEFAAGHAPGAANLPRGLLEFKIAELIPNPKTSIVVYCKSGDRGSLSVCALKCMGYANAANLDGGWKAWLGAGLPADVGAASTTQGPLGLPAEAGATPTAPCKEDLVREAKGRIIQVSPAQAVEMQSQGGVILDCREKDEYADGHAPGALHIPRGLLEFKIAEAIPDKQTRIVLYCKTGGRGCLATCALKCMGYANVANLDGGWKAWVKAGLPVEKSGAPAAQAPAGTAVQEKARQVEAQASAGALTKQELVRLAKADIRAVDAVQAKAMLDRGWTYFIDCREPVEFRRGHVPGALNIARGWLEFKIAEAVPEKDADIVLYCKSGDRSSLGVQALNRMGYVRAVNLDGGWNAWLKTEYPVQ